MIFSILLFCGAVVLIATSKSFKPTSKKPFLPKFAFFVNELNEELFKGKGQLQTIDEIECHLVCSETNLEGKITFRYRVSSLRVIIENEANSNPFSHTFGSLDKVNLDENIQKEMLQRLKEDLEAHLKENNLDF